MTQFANKFTNNNYYGGAYKLGPNPSFPDIFAFVQANPVNSLRRATRAEILPTLIDRKGSAGYLMNTLDISSRWRLVAGVRFEGTNLDTSSFKPLAIAV